MKGCRESVPSDSIKHIHETMKLWQVSGWYIGILFDDKDN